MVDIANIVESNFFDHSLRSKPLAGELSTAIPEIVIRQHSIDAQPLINDN
jgi:hypothetical protein